MNGRTLLFFIATLLSGSFAYGQNINAGPYSEISEERWLPKYSILSIFQDSQGYFWIGTNSGLFKFNGLETKHYTFTQNDKNTLLNNTIRDIAEDRFGNVYIATGSGLGLVQTDSYKTELVLDFAIRNIETAPDGGVWATTANAQNLLYKINPSDSLTRESTPYLDGNDPVAKKIRNGIRCLYQGADGHLWMGSTNGIFFLNTQKKKLYDTNFDFSVNEISVDEDGVLWIGSASRGLFAVRPKFSGGEMHLTTIRKYDLGKPQEASFNRVNVLKGLEGNRLIAGTYNHLYLSELDEFPRNEFQQPTKTLKAFADNNVLCTLVDREQNIWIGTLHGLYKLKNQDYLFRRIKLATPDYIPINNKVARLSADDQGNIWIVSNYDGLFRYDPENKTVERIQLGEQGQVKSLVQGANGDYIINIKDKLYKVSGPIVSGIPKEQLKPLPLSNAEIHALLEVSPGDWWVGTWNDGLLRVSDDSNAAADPFFERVSAIDKKLPHISCMVKDHKGNVWIGHRGNGIIKANRSQNTVEVYHAGSKGLKSDRILSIYADKKDRVWIATRGHGVQIYDETRDTFESFTKEDGLPSNTVCAFGEDAHGDLWVSTQNGLAKYLPGQPVPFQYYGIGDGIVHPEFSFNAAVNDQRNTLYFGNADGIYFLQWNKVSPQRKRQQTLVFADFEILNAGNNQDSTQHFTAIVRKNGIIHLPHKHNSFLISFSSLDFTSPQKVKYAYRLKGYEDSWIYTSAENRVIQYLDIPAGHYTFEVKSSDSNGIWYDEKIAFTLNIDPPFWLSTAAYVAYGVLALTILVLALYFLRRWFSLKHQLKEEAAVLRLQTQQMVYFSDLSHEIKNRLTLILGPLETVLKGKKVNKTILQNLYEQALLLKRINEQIISIRKSETGEFLLNVREGDISRYISEVCESVKPLALIREITLDYRFEREPAHAWFDKELLEIVLLNLLTNAIKYSRPGNNVSIKLTNTTFGAHEVENGKPGNYICCVVEDSGIGIPSEELKRVVEPFYRAKNGSKGQEGAGLGLNLVQRLIGRHYGWMKISSEENKSTVVTFYLPAEKQHYALNELQPSLTHSPIVELNNPAEAVTPGTAAKANTVVAEKKAKILIVDDEADVRAYIAECLSEDFETLEACNGEAAYQQLINNEVSLVLSDLAMPVLDGISLLRRIKASQEFNDIPVIILTGRSSHSEKRLCLQHKADDFVEKPFSPELLRYRIKNLLSTRELLKDKFIRKISVSTPAEVNVLSPDEKFIQEVVELIDSNLSNTNLNVGFLAEHMCMSRATLYRRMEELLNESPSEFIRKARLKRAAMLLQTDGKRYISEIAYMVGAKTPKQFSRSFQKEYGITPTDYMKQEGASCAMAE